MSRTTVYGPADVNASRFALVAGAHMMRSAPNRRSVVECVSVGLDQVHGQFAISIQATLGTHIEGAIALLERDQLRELRS